MSSDPPSSVRRASAVVRYQRDHSASGGWPGTVTRRIGRCTLEPFEQQDPRRPPRTRWPGACGNTRVLDDEQVPRQKGGLPIEACALAADARATRHRGVLGARLLRDRSSADEANSATRVNLHSPRRLTSRSRLEPRIQSSPCPKSAAGKLRFNQLRAAWRAPRQFRRRGRTRRRVPIPRRSPRGRAEGASRSNSRGIGSYRLRGWSLRIGLSRAKCRAAGGRRGPAGVRRPRARHSPEGKAMGSCARCRRRPAGARARSRARPRTGASASAEGGDERSAPPKLRRSSRADP